MTTLVMSLVNASTPSKEIPLTSVLAVFLKFLVSVTERLNDFAQGHTVCL